LLSEAKYRFLQGLRPNNPKNAGGDELHPYAKTTCITPRGTTKKGIVKHNFHIKYEKTEIRETKGALSCQGSLFYYLRYHEKISCFFKGMVIFYKIATMGALEENIKNIWSRIENAAEKTGKSKGDIKLVAVTKTVETERIKEAINRGIQIIGENRVQEAESKFDQITEEVEKHLVGHLQTNKAKTAVELFDFIQSVDSQRIAQEISRRASQMGKVMEVLVEINTSGEETKFGIDPDEVLSFVKSISNLEGIKIKGLMTIGLFSDNPEDTRPCFKRLKAIFDQMKSECIPNVEMKYLSMGMTSDFEVAIQEGSNMVRVGTGIFGPRK